MLARVATFALDGLDPQRVIVEVDVRPGLPAFTVVGLGDAAVRESRERVRAALLNSGFEFPLRRITANLAPASLRKVGPGFDLALAIALLAATGQVPVERLAAWAVFGELSLSGEVRPCRGGLVVAEGTRRAGLTGLVLSDGQVGEAALVDGLQVAGAATLRDVSELLRSGRRPTPGRGDAPDAPDAAPEGHELDVGDVRGQDGPLTALRIAAAGGHNLLLEGQPGTGKTMLARRLPSILPPLTRAEALEVTRIRSVTGLPSPRRLPTHRPFRAPHHGISPSGLVGGGSAPSPGEATLAHNGVLFLDELTEFSRSALEALRQPLEDGRLVVVRNQHAVVFPTRCMLIAATNPCPCGYASTARCRCAPGELSRHARRLSGPLLDRLDLLVAVERPEPDALHGPPTASSAAMRGQVLAAQQRQQRRLIATDAACNAQMDAQLVQAHVPLGRELRRVLARAEVEFGLSARGQHRVLRVARTVADLDDEDRVAPRHLLEALNFRQRLAGAAVAA